MKWKNIVLFFNFKIFFWSLLDLSDKRLMSKFYRIFIFTNLEPLSSLFFACGVLKLLQSCLTVCDPMDCSLSGSSVLGIFQARTLEWVATISSSRGSSRPRDRTCSSCSSCTAGRIFTAELPGKQWYWIWPSKKISL